MSPHPAFFLLLAIVLVASGAENLWQWYGDGGRLDLFFGIAMLALAPVLIAHFFRAIRHRRAAEKPE